MARQHATPILLSSDGAAPLALVSLTAGPDAVSEAALQQLIHENPSCLPIVEIDPLFCGAVPICTELNTPAGPIDNFMVTKTGLPVLVECKLWRNPEMRRQVVSQILDYAKELSRWSSSDLQREASRRLGRTGNALLDLVREAGHEVDEAEFNDALTANLRRGRFLLLIVGDGIREGVEAITEYLQVHAGLHFTLGLVELPIFSMSNGDRLVVPRVLARTQLITRTVIAVPDGFMVRDQDSEADSDTEEQIDELGADRKAFWTEFVMGLHLDDPEQQAPRASSQGFITLPMPVPSGSAWITIFRNVRDERVGLFLSYTRNTPGERIVRRVVEVWSEIRDELDGSAILFEDNLGRPLIHDSLVAGSFSVRENRDAALVWLRQRLNDFVNVLRPRLRAAAADLEED